MTIGNRIKTAREAKGLTQEELGAACGTTKQSIFKYETGIVTNIPLDRIEKIAEILEVSPASLMGWEPPPEENKPAEPELDELDKEFIRLVAQLTPEQRRRQIEVLQDIVGRKDT